MSDRKDILVSQQNEIIIENGDFVIGASDTQHVDHIVTATKGEYKMTPQLGFGVIEYIKSQTSKSRFKRDLREQLKYDQYLNPSIDLSNGFKQLEIKI